MHRFPALSRLSSGQTLALTVDRGKEGAGSEPAPCTGDSPRDAPARRRVDHRHCARLRPGTKASVGSVPPDGVAVASSAPPCAGSSPPAGAHSLRIAARQPCGLRLGPEVAPPVLPLLSYCSSRFERPGPRSASGCHGAPGGKQTHATNLRDRGLGRAGPGSSGRIARRGRFA